MPEKNEAELLTAEDLAFARRVREERESRGWTQMEMVTRLHRHGLDHLTQATVSRIEHGKRAARLGEAEGIAQIFQVPLALLTVIDERASFAKTLMGSVVGAQKAIFEVRDRAKRAGETWRGIEVDIEILETSLASDAYEGHELPPEARVIVDDYLRQARAVLSYPLAAVFEQSFREGRGNGAATDAD